MARASAGPLLGSDYLRSLPSTPTGVDDVQPSTCVNLSRFKHVLAQYRALDDGIIYRLNRSHALNRARDQERYSHFDDTECASIWSSLTANWAGRERIIRYCVDVADPARTAPLPGDTTATDEPFARETLRQQLSNELAVETIVRRRTMTEFLRRCTAFVPPPGSIPAEDLSHLPAPTRERLL